MADWKRREEAARALGISHDTLQRRIGDGTIAASAVSAGTIRGRPAVLVDIEAAALCLYPAARALVEARDAELGRLRRQVADLTVELDYFRSVAEPAAAAEGIVLEGDRVIERHGLPREARQRR
jgi:hypothetical protein